MTRAIAVLVSVLVAQTAAGARRGAHAPSPHSAPATLAADAGAASTADTSSTAPAPPAPPRDERMAAIRAQITDGHYEPARTELESLTRDLPDDTEALFFFALVDAHLNRVDDALDTLARLLRHELTPSQSAQALALRAQLYARLHDDFRAASDARAALQHDPSEPNALAIVVADEARAGNFVDAAEHAERLVRAAPDSGRAHAMLAAVLVRREQFERAHDESVRARALGVSGPTLDEVDAAVARARRDQLLWQVPLVAFAVLAGLLLLLFVLGRLLSRAQLAHLRAVAPHLLRNEETAGERVVGRLYLALVWAASALFYVSVPVMLAVTLLVGPLVVGAMLLAHVLQVQLLIIALVVGFGGSWAILRGLFLARRPPPQGRILRDEDAPRLFAALREAAETASARPVDRVYLTPGANVGVFEEGGTLRVLFGRGTRSLTIGLGALQGLGVSELKSILAHEYGHFAHGKTRVTPVVGRITGTLVGMLTRIAKLEFAQFNPAFWFLRLYLAFYLQITAGHGRRRELLADRTAALSYGGDTFARALTRVVAFGDMFDRAALSLVAELRAAGRPCTDLFANVVAAYDAMPETLREKRLAVLMDRPAGRYDSHPAPADRIRRVAGIAPARPVDDAPATSLLGDADTVARELTAKLVGEIDKALDQRGITTAEAVETDVTTERELAAALVLFRDAQELRAAKDPAANALLEDAVSRLERALPEGDDVLLIGPLFELGRKRREHRDLPGARESLERALAIAESCEGIEGVETLRAELEQVRRASAA